MVNKVLWMTRGGSTVVDHSSHHQKVKGLSPADATGTGRKKLAKKPQGVTKNGSTLVDQSFHHAKVGVLIKADATATGRE